MLFSSQYEIKKWAEDKMPNWSDMSPNDVGFVLTDVTRASKR